MSVELIPLGPLDARAQRFISAALIAAQKPGRAATRRCAKRRRRAIAMLQLDPPQPNPLDDAVAREAAVTWLRRACETCRKCAGV